MNNYPPQLPPPQQPGGYNPYNPYQGFDPNADYVQWLPGRQSPRFLPIAIIVVVVLICSCCSFLAGTVFGIELPGWLAPSSSSQNQNNSSSQDGQPTEEAPPEQPLEWRLILPQNT